MCFLPNFLPSKRGILMLNLLWPCLILASILFGLLNGRVPELTNAFFAGAADGVQLFLTLLGMIALWNGIMKVAEAAGVTKALCRLFAPVVRRLFPGNDPEGPAARAISMNIAANMLGLGNAALPMGLAAMREMQKHNRDKLTATRDMVTFVVMNTASVQLIPATVAMLRAKYGSAAPMEILPAVWLVTACSMAAGLCAAKVLGRKGKDRL